MSAYPTRSVGGVLISLSKALSPQVDKPLKSVMHGQCDARPTVTFPAAGHHRPLTGTKLYCLVTEVHVCEQLAQGCYMKARGRESNPRPSKSQVQRPNHYATRPHSSMLDRVTW